MLTALLATAALVQVTFGAVQTLGSGGQCLQVTGTAQNGSPVTLGECSAANAQMQSTGQQWVISQGNNPAVQLFGTSLCLDAGPNPTPGRASTVALCQGSATQAWYLTPDNRVAVTGGNQCLEAAGSTAQTGNCGPGITAQEWTPSFLFNEPTSTSSAAASSTASSVAGGAGGVVGGATQSASSVASSSSAAASSVASSASGAVTGASASAASATSGASSAASSAASGASSVASGASSAASSATSGAGSAAGAATSGAGSVGGAATSGAGSVGRAATSGAGSVAGAATSGAGSVAGAATSGVGSVAGGATSVAGGATSALGSVAGAATSAVTPGRSAGFVRSQMPSVLVVAGMVFGGFILL